MRTSFQTASKSSLSLDQGRPQLHHDEALPILLICLNYSINYFLALLNQQPKQYSFNIMQKSHQQTKNNLRNLFSCFLLFNIYSQVKMSNKNGVQNNRNCSIFKESNLNPNTSDRTKKSKENISLKRNNLKSVQCMKNKYTSPTKKKEIVQKMQKKEFDLSEAMRIARQKDINQITKNVAILKYYNCLIMLFMTVFTSSQLIITNLFQKQHKSYPSFGFKLIDGLLKFYEITKKCEKQKKIKRLATNIMKIASMPSLFQRKIQFISRKVVLNYERRKQIQLCFIEDEVESFWQKFCKIMLISDQVEFMEDIFQFPSQKLCLKHFQYFIENYLSTPLFQFQLQQLLVDGRSTLQQTFTVQFLLIEKMCLLQHRETSAKMLKKPNNVKKCDIY